MDRERRVVYDPVTGFAIDAETGEVIDDRPIDCGYDARVSGYDDYVRKARAGGAVTPSMHDSGLHSYVGGRNGDRRSRRLSKINESVRVSKKDRKVVGALSLLHRYASVLGIPDKVVDHAGKMVRKLLRQKTVGKRYMNEYVAVALVESAKMFGIPISLGEAIARLSLSWENVKVALRSYKKLGLLKPIITDPKVFVPKIIDSLGLGSDAMNIANRIIDAMKRIGMTGGKSPNVVAGAAVYIASIVTGDVRTQQQVSDVSGCKEAGIRNMYHEITKRIDIEVKL